IEVLETERRDVERDRDVDAYLAPVEPLPEDGAQTPQGELVDQSVIFSEPHEARRLHRPEFRIVPADQGLDPDQSAVAQRHLGLVDHVEPLLFQRPPQSSETRLLGFAAHRTSVALNLLITASRSSSRTGFSTGPAMLSPSASPSRKADSRTRRSKPLTIRTGER